MIPVNNNTREYINFSTQKFCFQFKWISIEHTIPLNAKTQDNMENNRNKAPV